MVQVDKKKTRLTSFLTWVSTKPTNNLNIYEVSAIQYFTWHKSEP